MTLNPEKIAEEKITAWSIIIIILFVSKYSNSFDFVPIIYGQKETSRFHEP